MGLRPLKWEAKTRCIELWHKVITMGEERLVKRVAMVTLSLKGKVKWRENLERCPVDFGLGDVRLDSLKGMSNAEVKYNAKELCMEGSDQDVGRGVGGAAKAVCVKRAG